MSLYVFYACKDNNCGCYCILKTYLPKHLFKKNIFAILKLKIEVSNISIIKSKYYNMETAPTMPEQ